MPDLQLPVKPPPPPWGRAGVGFARIPPIPCSHTGEKDKFRRTVRHMATVARWWGKPHPTNSAQVSHLRPTSKNVGHECPTYNSPLNRPSPRGGGLGWGLPAYRRCPVAIPVSFQNFRVRVGYAATHPTHEIHHRVRLGAPSGTWRRLCDGGASPTLRTVGRPFMADSKKNVGHECPTYNLPTYPNTRQTAPP